MTINNAFRQIFRGYVLIFLNLNLFSIDLIPNILGYYWVAKGWKALCAGGLTGLSPLRQQGIHRLIQFFIVVSVGEQIWAVFNSGSGAGGLWDVTLPETPPLFQFPPSAIASLLLFLAGLWIMTEILIASRNMALAEGKAIVVRGLERSLHLLITVYLPVGIFTALMEQCVNLPDLWWGNVIHGIQDLASLMYFSFQLMLVLQIANMRKNLDCCKEIEAEE